MNLDLSAVLAIVVPIAAALGIVVWWIMRKSDARIDAEATKREEQIKAERAERVAAMAAFMESARQDREMFFKAYREERDAREAFFRATEKGRQDDRHDSADMLQRWVNEFNLHQQRVIREHPTYDRMAEIMKPVADGLEDVKTALERVFERLDGKADKPRAQGA